MKSVSGSLASQDLLAAMTTGGVGTIRNVLQRARGMLGPATSARLVFDALLLPLLSESGATASVAHADNVFVAASFGFPGYRPAGVASAGGWGCDLARLRDRTARLGLPGRWWIGANGPTLRVMDVSHAYTRRTLDFDLQRIEDEEQALSALRALMTCSGERMPALEDVIARSAVHRLSVGRSLQAGVDDALARLMTGFEGGRRRPSRDASFGDALTVVYRILFLLFAEARGLVPHWHPIYRDSYTIESLRPIVEAHAIAGRIVGIAPGDFAARPSRLHRWHPARRPLQRPSLRPLRRAIGRLLPSGRPRRARCPAGRDDSSGPGPAAAHLIRRSRRRAARSGLRARPRLHAGRRAAAKAAARSIRRGR